MVSFCKWVWTTKVVIRRVFSIVFARRLAQAPAPISKGALRCPLPSRSCQILIQVVIFSVELWPAVTQNRTLFEFGTSSKSAVQVQSFRYTKKNPVGARLHVNIRGWLKLLFLVFVSTFRACSCHDCGATATGYAVNPLCPGNSRGVRVHQIRSTMGCCGTSHSRDGLAANDGVRCSLRSPVYRIFCRYGAVVSGG